jgi:arylsulfatase A-like enzyme
MSIHRSIERTCVLIAVFALLLGLTPGVSALAEDAPSAATQPAPAVTETTPSVAQAPAAGVTQSTKPNFVVVVTDDQRWDTIGRCLPVLDPYDFHAGADACMPKLQQFLTSAGLTFLHGNVTQSLCCPSRASILTGQYSTTTGVTYNSAQLFDDSSTIATWLEAAGYRNGLIGKYLNGYGNGALAEYIPPGWDTWEAYHGFSNSDDPYVDYPWISWHEGDAAPAVTRINDADSTSGEICADGNLYSTDYQCNLAIDFLQADAETPFFLHLSPANPHTPLTLPERHRNAFLGMDVPQYPSTNVLPAPNPPSHLPTADLSDRLLDRIERTIVSSIEMTLSVDDMIGAVHDQLAADGRLDNTVWVFISDNGISTGEHHWRNKGCEYYTCHQVPYVVVCPPTVCPGATPGTVDSENYALNIDIAPTLADLAGATPTIGVDGASLVPLLNDPDAEWRDEWFMHGNNPEYEGIVGIGTDGDWYKYVELTSAGEYEMYNLNDDPWELVNLAGDGGYATVQADLAARLAAHLGGAPANVAPVADFGWSCVDLDCVFTDLSFDSDGLVVGWDWGFGDGVGFSSLQSPSYSFGLAGTYSVSLTVVDDDGGVGAVSQDVTVSAGGGEGAFIESDGTVVFEAESYFENISRSGDTWTEIIDPEGSSGDVAMQTLPDDGTRLRTDLPATSPEMTYDVDFTTTDTYYIWLRTWAPDAKSKGVFVGIDGVVSPGIAAGGNGTRGAGIQEWSWSNVTHPTTPVSLEVGDAGVHTIQVFMGDDGLILDKVVLTTDPTFIPVDLGPPESPRQPL